MTAETDSNTLKADILVTGAGAAGLSAAIALAKSGFSVICAGKIDTKVNGRTVALFDGSLRFYKALGLWDRFAPLAAPLRRIRMVDDTGSIFRGPDLNFASDEIDLDCFGENVTNNDLVAGLAEIAKDLPNLTLIDAFFTSVEIDEQTGRAVLEDGRILEATLIVAADGRRSLARDAAHIGVDKWSYPQMAMTVLLAHEEPNDDTSTEFHTRNGPCTLVPLAGTPEHPHRSSLVWLMSHREAERRMALPADVLEMEIETQVRSLLGKMKLDGPLGCFPMAGMKARKYSGDRIALIGETAHVFPPIGAQGLNLSLRDIASLVDALEESRSLGEDIGGAMAMRRYDDSRRADISFRTRSVDILNRSLLADFVPVDFLRTAGIIAFSLIGPLRRAIMREGVMPHGQVPRLMRLPQKTNVEHRRSSL